MRWIVGSSLQFRVLVCAVAAALMIFGAARLRNMPVDALPEFSPPFVEIQTEALGLSAADVESLVTLNLEELLAGTAWLQTIRSKSVPGMSSVMLIFEPGTDIMRARQVVQERLVGAYLLPNVSKAPVMLQPLSAANRVMMIGLSSKQLSPIQMSVISQWTIKPKLLGVKGVANVAVWGERKRQLHVQVDPERLRAHGVTQEQVISSAGDALWVSDLSFLKASVPGSGGFIDTPNQRLEIRHVLPMSSAEELAKVSLDESTLRLGDVAKVVEGHPPLIGDAVINGGSGLLLVIEKFPGTNALEVTRGVEAALAALRPGLPGLEIDSSIFRAASYVETSIDHLSKATLVGAVLLTLALAGFLVGWRAALISLVAIPLSLVTAAVVLYLQGATINAMILAGFVVALGAIIDDAIVDVEHIARRLREHRQAGGSESTASVIIKASLEMRGAIVYATLIALLAVSPAFFLGGLAGAFLEPLAQSYVLALLASLAVALTVTPALCLLLLSKTGAERESPVGRWLQRRYERALAPAVRAPLATLAAAGVLAAAGFAIWPLFGNSLLPSFKERNLLITWEGAPGTSQPEMYRIANQAGRELKAIPGVSSVTAHVGRAVAGDQVVSVNSSQIWVGIDPAADYDATLAAVTETVDGYPGIHRIVQTYLGERVREAQPAKADSISVRVSGPDLAGVRRSAEEVKQAISGIDGLTDVRIDAQAEEPQVQVKVNLDAAGRYGLKPGDVRRAAATVFSGLEVGKIFEAQKVFEVVVWSTPEKRHSVSSIRDLLIETEAGGHVRVGDVAEVSIVPTPAVIRHEAIANYLDVVAGVRGGDPATVVAEVKRRLDAVKFPLEYHPAILGEYAERGAAQKRLLGIAAFAALGILLLLQASFGSWLLAAVTFVALSAALAGGAAAAFAGGGIITVGSLFGLLAVLGIAARNSIVLIRNCRLLERREGASFGPELVLRGAQERLSPIVMSSACLALALLPLVLFGNIAGLEIVHPMAVVILGGLVTATLISLFVVPALFLRFGHSRESEMNLGVN